MQRKKVELPSAKNAIVTGAASGLGRAIAVELARNGWYVAIADLNEVGGRETLELVRAAGGDGQVETLDVTQPDSWRSLRQRLETSWTRLDLLVNNAGVGMACAFDQWSLDDWRWIVDINVFGAINGCREMFTWLKANPDGSHVVNVASLAAIAPSPGMAPYNVTKAAILSFSETTYTEFKPHRIGVTVVCPGFVPTNIVKNGRFPVEQDQRLISRLMNMSQTTPEEVGRQTVRGIQKKLLYVFVPRSAKTVWRLKRLLPVWLLNSVARERGKEAAALNKQG